MGEITVFCKPFCWDPRTEINHWRSISFGKIQFKPPTILWVQIEKEVISDLKCENQHWSRKISLNRWTYSQVNFKRQRLLVKVFFRWVGSNSNNPVSSHKTSRISARPAKINQTVWENLFPDISLHKLLVFWRVPLSTCLSLHVIQRPNF
jgi:hypothetical protein